MYIAPSYQVFLTESSQLEDKSDFFYRLLLNDHIKINNKFVEVMKSFQGHPLGIEFKKANCTQWAFIVPEMSEVAIGNYRLQRFDLSGFFSHQVCKSLDEAVEHLVREGFLMPEPGILDKLQHTPKWQRGVIVTDIIRRCNSKQISWDQAHEEHAALEIKFPKVLA